jgi:hypothetical protein
MDGTVAIEENRQALSRIVAMLIDMAGLGEVGAAPTSPSMGEVDAKRRVGVSERRTLPRILWRAILALLRPAESAARRLIIAASRGLSVPPPRPRKPKPPTMEPLLRKFGIAVMVPPAGAARAAFLPRSRGRGTGHTDVEPRIPAFPLFDPPRRFAHYNARHTVPPHLAPRICVPGVTERTPLPPPPSPDDFVSATRLTQRLAALAAALDDLPGQARRFARLKARLDARHERDPKTPRRISPIRRARPPGGRLFRYDPNVAHPPNIREVDQILAHAHDLALFALESPDTS